MVDKGSYAAHGIDKGVVRVIRNMIIMEGGIGSPRHRRMG
jgi:hypothetical protein